MWRVQNSNLAVTDQHPEVVQDYSGQVWVFGESEEEARQTLKEAICQDAQAELIRDEDVLDTWFSSALIPFANFGWPDKVKTHIKIT